MLSVLRRMNVKSLQNPGGYSLLCLFCREVLVSWMSAVPGESGWAGRRPPSAWEATVPIGPLAGALPGVLGGKGTCLMAHGVSEGQGTYTRTHEPTLRYVHPPPPHTHTDLTFYGLTEPQIYLHLGQHRTQTFLRAGEVQGR